MDMSSIYETLDPLGFSSDNEEHELRSYAVFRSEIIAFSDLIVDIPVSNYFPIDASGDLPNLNLDEQFSLPSISTPDPCSLKVACPIASETSWFRSGCSFKSPMLQLHKEILDFSEFISPTPEEQTKRAAAVDRVFEVVKYIWPHCRVEVFGSFKTGLYLPTSDIDVVILKSKVGTPQSGLYALAKAFSQKGIAKKIQVIPKARVPILKFVEKESQIAFDLSFDIDSGPKAADFIKDVVESIPPLRHLCLILKVFLQQRELNEVYSGGVGSYALLAMLIAHLQIQQQSTNLHGSQKFMENNLGILLVKFFELYGRKLNTYDVGVSCNSLRNFFLKCDKGFLNTEKPNLLAIEDPQAQDNDIGRSSFNYFKVRSAFAMAFTSLTDSRATKYLDSQNSILGIIIRPDPVLLDRKGGCNGELMLNILLPRAGDSASQHLSSGNDIIHNWQLVDDEPFPRDILSIDDKITSTRRRAALRKKRRNTLEKTKNNDTRDEFGSFSGRAIKKKKRFQDRDCYGHNSFPRRIR